ncbi:Na+/H+ antiporter subunit A [Micromonospora fiedleri]|uniref:Na+/H+ antiporter subunit A n=1 Tax=Micromonospora fiedleri TaxID=1157498 RepID=A0ABS1UM13_9ACTN|nr:MULTISPECIES: Na+/H+ antiporter subunit A [Micromonospora]MBL6276396.1 Na+/H+ antiporter subunit A [Micromonospora fiedleri]WSK40432.1 Na+/H+ antiporter subunit A [Micromonospora maris]
MLVLVAVHALTAVIAPALVRLWGRHALYVVALVPGATLAWALTHTGDVRSGEPVVETVTWVPQLDLELALRMGTLSWLMVVLVGGVGALVLAYSARYFRSDDPGLGRFVAVFVAFAGAMLGLVVSDDLLLLYVFWELTTVFSYLLIGYDPAKRASRRAAMQALLVTTLGGLAMLAGFVMLGQHAGSYRWSVVAENLPGGGYLAVALVLILLGALSKSAIFPFSFWLPGAMAAPTPVSAYLHAAAMVKAGVFLVALMGPAVAEVTPWRPVLLVGGLITMFLGGWSALRQVDLKLLLAYGTVSQLGLLMVILGAGTRDAALAGVAMVLAHALFKATLFLTVGIIDHATGTRDLRELSGVGRRAPALAVVAGLAAASMAGLPPMAGFVAKEAAVEALLHGGTADLAVLAGVIFGSALTVAYTLRYLWGAFADKPGVEPTTVRPVSWAILTPAAVLAVAGVAVGVLAPAVDRLLAPYADLYRSAEPGYHLALWHGLTPALGLSVLAVAGGAGLFDLMRRERVRATMRLPFDGAVAYKKCINAIDRLAVELTGRTQRGSLPFYLGVILVVMVVLPGGALLAGSPWPQRFHLWDTPLQGVAAAMVVIAAVMAARALRRLTAMILVGVAGYGIALMFILHGAPDLALTQFLVETVTIVMFVLVLRRLPAKFSERPIRSSRRGRVAIGVAVGAVTAGMAYVAAGARQAVPISVAFPDEAVSYGGGKNVVNVTLVDIRAWDTMGEIAVLVVAATGVASLIFRHARDLGRRGDIPGDGPTEYNRPRWLTTGATARSQSVILQVITRLLFHAIVLFSIYLLFSGHNAPGGGFAAGLVAGLALAVRYLAGGRTELNGAAPVDAGVVLGAGLFVAVGTGVAAMLLGGEFLQSALLDFHLPVLGHIHFVTSAFFDVGVYLIVVGLVLDILRSLGAEMDRQHETEGDEVREKELV